MSALIPITGCGNGKYLHINGSVFKLGCDICRPLVDSAWSQGHEVQLCDSLRLPYRDSCFDGVLSIAGRPMLQLNMGGYWPVLSDTLTARPRFNWGSDQLACILTHTPATITFFSLSSSLPLGPNPTMFAYRKCLDRYPGIHWIVLDLG